MSLIKKLARWVLREEIAAKEKRIHSAVLDRDIWRKTSLHETRVNCWLRLHLAKLKTERRIRAPKLP